MSILNKSFIYYDLNNNRCSIDLTELAIGQKVKVIEIAQGCNNYYRQRLLAQGVIPGVIMQIKKIAPLGDPIEFLLPSGRSFIVRKNEASIIKVVKLFD